MADLGGVFNANDVPPSSFDVLPSGEYEVVIVNSQMKATQTGGQMLKLELQVLNGQYQNRKIWDNLNLVNASDKAVQIARGTLSAICRAVGVLTPRDSAELHNRPLRAKLVVEKSEEYGEQNRVKAYKPRNAGPAPVAAQSIPPAAQPDGETDSNTPPWA